MSWGYEKGNGPDTWIKSFEAARGPRQSPVDINTKATHYDPNLAKTPLTIKYQNEPTLHLENPGLSFKAHISADSTITGGPLGKDVYRLVQFHFHWGLDDKSGSEHTLNGKMYPSELHLVHYNTSKYASFADAVTQPDGLAVIGVLIKVGPRDHEGFNLLSSNTSKVKCKGSCCDTGVTFNPSSLLPEDVSRYWTYEGSLTTPPCHESVTWIVLKQEIAISCDQIRAMRNLCCDDCGSKPIPANYRPPLPLGTRKITCSFAN
jgi:carbonic anhydrase